MPVAGVHFGRLARGVVFFLCVSLALAGCGNSGDSGGGGGTYNPVWVSIDTANLDSVVTQSSVTLSGDAYCGGVCPESEVGFGYCPPFQYVSDVPVDVTWRNRTTGEEGPTLHGVSGTWVYLFSYCWTSYSHAWTVYSVPLAMGDNLIEVTATDLAGNSATGTVTITRAPVPVFYAPTALAVDLANGELLVASEGRATLSVPPAITVFDLAASGDAAPLRALAGRTTGLAPQGMALDPAAGEVFTANREYWDYWYYQDHGVWQTSGLRSMTSHARAASVDTAPLRTISGPDTGILHPFGVAVDPAHGELFTIQVDYSAQALSRVTVHAVTADGNTAPLRTIEGPSAGLIYTYGITLDTVHDELLLVSIRPLDNFGTTEGSVRVFGRMATGDAAPLRVVEGPATGLIAPAGIAVDPAQGEVFVTDRNTASVMVFARTASGDRAPLRVLAGPATGLTHPSGIAVDTTHGEIFVADSGDNTVKVFARTASGNAAPLRVLVGAWPGL